jgi:hypothetical protein
VLIELRRDNNPLYDLYRNGVRALRNQYHGDIQAYLAGRIREGDFYQEVHRSSVSRIMTYAWWLDDQKATELFDADPNNQAYETLMEALNNINDKRYYLQR